MGGYGSGNRYRISKKTTGLCLQLDARHLQRENALHPGFSYTLSCPDRNSSIGINVEDNRLHLHFYSMSHGVRTQNVNQYVQITWTTCNLGGKRAWFLCPVTKCGKRVAILYCDGVFACRHCQQLAYRSQRLNSEDRAFRRANHIREHLGWEPGTINGIGKKPKGMHWRTYWETINEYNALVGTILKNSLRKIDRLTDML